MKNLNAESFGNIMNDIITERDIAVMIEMPAGTQEPTISGGTGVATIDLYFILAALKPTLKRLIRELGGAENVDVKGVIHGSLKLVEDDILKDLGIDGGDA